MPLQKPSPSGSSCASETATERACGAQTPKCVRPSGSGVAPSRVEVARGTARRYPARRRANLPRRLGPAQAAQRPEGEPEDEPEGDAERSRDVDLVAREHAARGLEDVRERVQR